MLGHIVYISDHSYKCHLIPYTGVYHTSPDTDRKKKKKNLVSAGELLMDKWHSFLGSGPKHRCYFSLVKGPGKAAPITEQCCAETLGLGRQQPAGWGAPFVSSAYNWYLWCIDVAVVGLCRRQWNVPAVVSSLWRATPSFLWETCMGHTSV